MLMERIMGALTFRQSVYEDVEKDTTFTSTAWILVAVVAFLAQLGANAVAVNTEAGVMGWLMGTVIGTVLQLLGFALACAIVAWVGRTLFGATATFDEMVRTVGLASIWNIVSFLAIVGVLGAALSCAVAPIQILAGIAGLVATAFALKAALDLDWLKTIITAVIAYVVVFVVVSVIGGVILGALGLGAAAAGQLTAP